MWHKWWCMVHISGWKQAEGCNHVTVSSCFHNAVPLSSSNMLTVAYSHLYSTPTASEYDFCSLFITESNVLTLNIWRNSFAMKKEENECRDHKSEVNIELCVVCCKGVHRLCQLPVKWNSILKGSCFLPPARSTVFFIPLLWSMTANLSDVWHGCLIVFSFF